MVKLCKCGEPIPLMRRKCDACNKKYHKQYNQAYAFRLRNYHREWMSTRRWLDGATDNLLLGEKIQEIKRMTVRGELIIESIRREK